MRNTRPFLLIAMIAVAIMLRGLIPTGYMPVIGQDKFFQITICSLDGLKTITVEGETGSQDHPETKKSTCPFAVLQTIKLALGTVDILPVLVVSFTDTIPPYFADTNVAQSDRLLIAQPRGPPVS